MSDPAKYTIGVITALPMEFSAAKSMLDEKHDPPAQIHSGDKNIYKLGRIYEHHVVITTLGKGTTGPVRASTAAKSMWETFPSLRMCLMVGIGGGVPSERRDMRLGDVVISVPSYHETARNLGGVFQYDFGNTIRAQSFQSTRYLNLPPQALLNAVTGLQSDFDDDDYLSIDAVIREVFDRNQRLARNYGRPDPGTDRLYASPSVQSRQSQSSSVDIDVDPPSTIVKRPERVEGDDPVIHYGLVATSDHFMEDAEVRDILSRDLDVLCFEMEAAGLMNDFPCLVIRGICDYSDRHRTTEWHKYASMTASACAKLLIRQLMPSQVKDEKKIADILSDLKEHMQISNDERRDDKEAECLQTFRLTDYEWYKSQVKERHDGTCGWVLQHPNFQRWQTTQRGSLLLAAGPGCGKSVLAKYLTDHILPQPSTTVCHFFFKSQDHNTIQMALCALIHQLIGKKPTLIRHAMPHWRKNGKRLVDLPDLLWQILRDATKDTLAGSLIFVLDALDECQEEQLESLVRNVQEQLQGDQVKVKFLFTYRPYHNTKFTLRDLSKALTNVQILGEKNLNRIRQDVDRVIERQAKELAKKMELPPDVADRLCELLKQLENRTYLWVDLIFRYLGRANFKRTVPGIELEIEGFKDGINAAYEQILRKAENHEVARKALCIILAAKRPLTAPEMNVAMNVDYQVQSFGGLDMEEEEAFKQRLECSCGLFISWHQDKIYFIHETAREFLVSTSGTGSPGRKWHHSITNREAHRVLAEVCVLYLDLYNSHDSIQDADSDVSAIAMRDGEEGNLMRRYAFKEYSAREWFYHVSGAENMNCPPVIKRILKIIDSKSESFRLWSDFHWWYKIYPSRGFTRLIIAAHLGLVAMVDHLLAEKSENIDAQESIFGGTALSIAARIGHEAVVEQLLEVGADIEARDNSGDTPLSSAAYSGNEKLVKQLLEKGADIEARNDSDNTPLLLAAFYGREKVVKELLEKGAKIEATNNNGDTPLLLAAFHGHDKVVKQLLEMGANIEAKNQCGQTPLLDAAAAFEVNKAMIEQLILYHADLKARDFNGHTALWLALNTLQYPGWDEQKAAVVKLLRENGADLEADEDYH